MGETFEALQEAQVLTFLEAGWASGGADLFAFFHDVLTRYPRLPVLSLPHPSALPQLDRLQQPLQIRQIRRQQHARPLLSQRPELLQIFLRKLQPH